MWGAGELGVGRGDRAICLVCVKLWVPALAWGVCVCVCVMFDVVIGFKGFRIF